MSALINVILPVFLIVGIGYLFGRHRDVDIRSFSTVSFYIFSPAIILSSFYNARLSGEEFARVAAFVLTSVLATILLAWLLARILRLDRMWESAFILSTSFGNVGNFGLPVALFAFGQTGLQYATLIFALSGVLANTLGVFFATRGQLSAREAFAQIFRTPLIYATALSLLINVCEIVLPDFIARPLQLLGAAAIPMMLIMLGLQLARTSFQSHTALLAWATLMRLVGGALIGFAFATLLGLGVVARQAAIVQSAMPAAVTVSLLAVQFDAHPEFVTSVVLISTLFSLITVTIVLNLV